MVDVDLQSGSGMLEAPGSFRKLHGAGNDFVLVTVSQDRLATDWSGAARRLCDRRTGIGADGLVLLAHTGADRFAVVCVNADGSIASMCGNALRCVAFAVGLDSGLPEMTLSMAGAAHHATATATSAAVTADLSRLVLDQLPVNWRGRAMSFDAVHTGTEHVVTVVEDLDDLDVAEVGRLVRHHHGLAPLGANVNFIQVGPEQGALRIRTFERGVEAETLSCGSGAVAAVAATRARGLIRFDGPITVHNRAGAPLIVESDPERPGTRFWVGGPVALVYQGLLEGASA